jgi:glycosyltransferase involved in cell wall biosynthesis
MKILQTISCISGNGLGKRSRFLGLISRSQHCFLIYSTPSDPGDDIFAPVNLEVSYQGSNWEIRQLVGSAWLYRRGAYFTTWLPMRVQLYRAARKWGISLVHAHDADLVSLAAFEVARWMGLPFIFEIHGLLDIVQENNSRRLRGLEIELTLARQAQCVIVQTEAMAHSLSKLGGPLASKVVVLQNHVDCNIYDPAKYIVQRAALRSEWGFGDNAVIFLYPGYLNWYNGIPQLLQALDSIPTDSPARFIICGHGELSDQVKQAVVNNPQRLHYLGDVPPNEMPHIYAATDSTVLPRPDTAETREATPMKLLEAMLMRHVVICTRVGGLTRVADEQTAILVAPDNQSELVAAIERVARDRAGLLPMTQQARQKVIHLMRVETSIQNLDDIYNSII